MTYAVIVKTRSAGTRVYGPVDAETAIKKFDQWEAKRYEVTVSGYDEGGKIHERPEDPVEVCIGTFAEEPASGN